MNGVDDDQDVTADVEVPAAMNGEMEKILGDVQLRQELGIGGAMTGPKGVLADYRFHNQQERLRDAEKVRAYNERLDAGALRSGWLERQIAAETKRPAEEDDDDIDLLRKLDAEEDDDFMRDYRARRLQEIAQQAFRPTFGTFKEVEVDDFVEAVDSEGPETVVIVHLYQPTHSGCRLVNAFLSVLAGQYSQTKFLRIESSKADPNFDEVALPALLAYRGGDVIKSLMRVTDEIDGWAQSGRCELEDFEQLLIKNSFLVPNEDSLQGVKA